MANPISTAAYTEGTVNATGDLIFVDGAWQIYTQRNGVEVNILKTQLASANEQLANFKRWYADAIKTEGMLRREIKALKSELDAVKEGLKIIAAHGSPPARTMGDMLACPAHQRVGLPLP